MTGSAQATLPHCLRIEADQTWLTLDYILKLLPGQTSWAFYSNYDEGLVQLIICVSFKISFFDCHQLI